MDKKTLRGLFALAFGCVVLWWLFLDTERVRELISSGWSLIAPFVIGSAIAFVFNVPMRAIERQLESVRNTGLRRAMAIVITLLLLALVIAFVVELLIPQIELTVDSLIETIPTFVMREVDNFRKLLEQNPELKDWVIQYTDFENVNWSEIIQQIVSFVGERMKTILDGAVGAIGKLTSGIVNTFIGVAFALYALARKEILARQGRRILYSIIPERACDETIRIFRLTNSTFSNFISGQFLEACILGCLFAVAMLIFDMPYIALVSVIIAVTALVPVVGAFVGCFLGAFFILVDNPVQALTFVAMFLVIQQLENNLIYPRVVGTSIGLPGMWVLVAVTVGGELMGVGGMLVMIPLTSVLYTLLREFTNRRLAQKNIPAWKLMNQPPEMRSKFKESRERKKERQLLKQMRELAQKRNETHKK